MSDLTRRLRLYVAARESEANGFAPCELVAEAADEIERLTRQHACDRALSDGVQREVNAMAADVARLKALLMRCAEDEEIGTTLYDDIERALGGKA